MNRIVIGVGFIHRGRPVRRKEHCPWPRRDATPLGWFYVSWHCQCRVHEGCGAHVCRCDCHIDNT